VPAFTVLISAQFCAAALLDHFGWLGAPLRPLDISRLVGILTVMFGIWLTLKK
jgi:transporter family-2 protein